MKSITIHGIDEETAKIIRKRAQVEGRSVNKIMKEMIGESLGPGSGKKDNREEFADLCGAWTENEEKAFLATVEDMAYVDEEDWG
jgi:plasmid stability protein